MSWTLDGVALGTNSAAPYVWTVTTTNGSHTLTATYVVSATTGATAQTKATFTVGVWTPPKPVYEEPGAALQDLWTTADNRAAPIPGLYDWSKAGFGGGTVLPDSSNVRTDIAGCNISAAQMTSDYGVVPNDGKGDTAGIQAAIDAVKANCSPTGSYLQMSIINLPAGTLNVTSELHLDANYMIVRGAGQGTGGTHLEYAPDANTRYDTITPDGTQWDQNAMTSGSANGGWIWPGRGLLRVQSREVAPKYAAEFAAAPANRKDLYYGTVNDHWISGLLLATKGTDTGYAGRKGDTVIQLAANADFTNLHVGGLVNVMAANSLNFYASMDAVSTAYPPQNQHMRQQVFMVTAGDPVAKTITLDKPLEYDLPVDSTSDGSAPIGGTAYPSKVTPLVDPVLGVGIEDLSYSQDEPNLKASDAVQNYGNMDPAGAMHGIVFKWAANCWVKNVSSSMTGSHPLVTEVAANLSVVDNHFDGAWNKGKGGNGYLRGSRVWDSLYAGNTTRNLRHFTFQWSASGNVAIGNSFDSDMNLHGGYERNNLFELNEVSIPYAHRSASCSTNCGDEASVLADTSDWYPIWWAAGQKAVKWSGASGPDNVFHDNHMRKQLGDDTQPYQDYAPYDDRAKIYQFGWDGSAYHPLDVGGTPIADWAHNETTDYSGHGVYQGLSDSSQSIFLNQVSLSGYGGPHPQPLRRTWGCSCWVGRGMVNTRLAADPVNTATGVLTEYFTDASIAGPGRALTFDRTYNSQDPTDGPLGVGWTLGYNASFAADPSDSTGATYLLRDPTGGVAAFTKNADGSFTAQDPGVTATVTARPGGGWRIVNQAQNAMDFDSSGRLLDDVDAQGHGATLAYGADGRLATATDTLGQTFTLSWGTSGAAAGRITGVAGSDGHSVGYAYTTVGSNTELSSVTGIDGKTTQYGYDTATGYLNQITDPDGHVSAKTDYDSRTGRVVAQTDATGGQWAFAWDQPSQTATVTAPDGTVTRDVYQGNVLVAHLGADGRATNTYYNSNNQVIASTGTDQKITRNEYDSAGNLTRRYLPALADDTNVPFETWTYDAANHPLTHTDASGNTTTYHYDSAGRLDLTTYPDKSTSSLTYTSLGQIASSTDQLGRTTTFVYDDAGNLVKTTTPGGAVTTAGFDNAHNRTWETGPAGNVPGASQATIDANTSHWTYDAFSRVLTSTDVLGRTTTNVYDATGNLTKTTAPDGVVTAYTYTAAGSPLKVTVSALGFADRVTSYGYDSAGRQISVTAPDGSITTTAYNALGQVASATGPAGNVPGVDAETAHRYTTLYGYDASGRQTQVRVVDPNNPSAYLVTRTAYDALGRPITTTTPDNRVTTTAYDGLGRVASVTAPDGTVTTTAYDAVIGRVSKVTGGGTSTTTAYDDAGQVTSTATASGLATKYTYTPDGQVHTVTAPSGQVTTYGYDAAGQQHTVTDPLGDVTTTDYDNAARVVKVTDANGHATGYHYDGDGNVDSVTSPTGAVTGYTYDTLGELTKTTTPNLGVYQYTYDTAGRVTGTTSPTGRTTSVSYTSSGKPNVVTLPSGATITYSYDTLGRTLKVAYSDTTPSITTTYDTGSRPLTVSDGTTAAAYTYDTAGRLSTLTRGGDVTTLGYDSSGRLASRAYSDGRTESYSYDADSRPADTNLSGGTLTSALDIGYSYDNAGRMAQVTRTGGPTTAYGYDNAGRLSAINNTLGASSLSAQQVTRDNAGAPTQVTTTRGSATSTALYGYDNAGQLTGVCTPASGTTCESTDPQAAYTYDGDGNRISAVTSNTAADTSTTYAYDGDDRSTSTTTGGAATTDTYDANGQLAQTSGPAGTVSYSYDLAANLRSVTLADGRSVTYTYDESGDRTSRTTAGTLDATWTWDTTQSLAVRTAETGASGTAHQWWSDPTGSLGTATLDTASATPTWLLGDYQGTITATATGAGLTGGGALDPFGQSTAPTTGDYTANPLRYQGQYLDSVTGLYDTRARDYDPSSARFTTPDTQSAAPGSVFFDTYAYGHNRPTSATDPSGRCPWCIGALVGAVAGGIYGGISCATDWHGWGNCAQKVGTDALIGGIAGGTLGYVAPEAVTFFAPDVLAESAGTSVTGTFLAQSTLVGAADYLATDWANTTFDGGTYTNAQATSDLFTGAVGGLAGPLTGAVASQLFDSAAAIAARWVARNDPGPEPAPATIACSDANAPAGGTGNGDPIPTGGAASSSGHSIWDDITATQPDYPGSALPKSFELTAGDTKVWVHGNATEHMAEYLSGMAARGGFPNPGGHGDTGATVEPSGRGGRSREGRPGV